jgi:hypothetical protein
MAPMLLVRTNALPDMLCDIIWSSMASPFSHNKKERRRLRKSAKQCDALAEIRPQFAPILEKMAADTLKCAAAKRRNRSPRRVVALEQSPKKAK